MYQNYNSSSISFCGQALVLHFLCLALANQSVDTLCRNSFNMKLEQDYGPAGPTKSGAHAEMSSKHDDVFLEYFGSTRDRLLSGSSGFPALHVLSCLIQSN